MRGSAVTEGISLIVQCDSDVKTLVVDHPIASQLAPVIVVSNHDVREAMRVGQSPGAYGFVEFERIEIVDRLKCVTRQLADSVSL